MRIVPLLPSSCAPESWLSCEAVELGWTGELHPDWLRPAAPPVHALHLPWQPWGPALGESALAALRPALGADFLVLRARAPEGRAETAACMGVLEGLLEVARSHGAGLKLALRPGPGAQGQLEAGPVAAGDLQQAFQHAHAGGGLGPALRGPGAQHQKIRAQCRSESRQGAFSQGGAPGLPGQVQGVHRRRRRPEPVRMQLAGPAQFHGLAGKPGFGRTRRREKGHNTHQVIIMKHRRHPWPEFSPWRRPARSCRRCRL